ncbi:MAG: carboxyl transferase domain-containing protein [Pseudomonadota bacterium]
MEENDNVKQNMLLALNARIHQTSDEGRQHHIEKRKRKGFNSARENLALLCDTQTFQEYGQFAVAAQRQRKDYEKLKSDTAADGVITGIGHVNAGAFPSGQTTTALVINDYSVLAGTQGYFHHLKLDRMIDVAKQRNLPVIMFTEGGGGRPGDADITTVNSGLQCQSFSNWAALSGVVPRIAVNNGYCFAGNAALFGSADITIATLSSSIGMAGPAMIEGGGLGVFSPEQIGPIETQAKNGVVDIVANDENHAIDIAKFCLSFFQGDFEHWQASSQENIFSLLPDDRRFAYDVRQIINTLVDTNSFIELKAQYGGAIITGFCRFKGKAVGMIASNCKVLGGAIDVDAAEKCADFLTLCQRFSLPVVSLCDTPGFMVGPEHEKLGAVRRLNRMFSVGASLNVPFIAVVLRKCYGLGAQAMLGGSTSQPDYTVSWPSGEFGAMGLEGAVKLGFKAELEQISDDEERHARFDTLLKQAYAKGQASEVASVLEIDAVIDPVKTRDIIADFFASQTVK